MELIKKKIFFKKVNKNDISKVSLFLSKYYNKKISKIFYTQRYLTNYSHSYICIYNDKIIGHVGFVRYLLNTRMLSKKYILSRHSSLIHPQFRKFGLFKKLCLFAIKKIKKNKNNLGFVIWPNDNNFLRFKKTNQVIFQNNYLIKLKKNKSYKKIPLQLTTNHIKIIKKLENHGLFEKNENYIKWKYFFKKDNSKYFIHFIKNKKEIASIFIYDINQKQELRVLEFFGKINNYINHVNNLLCYNKNIIFFYRLYNGKKLIIEKKYQTIAYFFSKRIKKIILKNKNFLSLGDTDTFINYEKIK